MGQNSYGVWAHVGLYKEHQGWVKQGKNLSHSDAVTLADRLRGQDITAYVKPMPAATTKRRSEND